MCKEYNGYSNYQTWNVALWLDNEPGEYSYVRDTAVRLEKTSRFADWLKDYVEEINPLNENASMFSDLMSHALANVNWYEIAKGIMEDEV